MTFRLPLLLLLGLALLAPPAYAQKDKKSAVPPQLPKGEMGKKKKKVEEPAGPASLQDFEQTEFDERVKALQRKKSELRKKKIGTIQQILSRNPYHDRKAELYHRLAEAHWNEAKYRFLLEMEKYRKQMDDFDAGTLSKEPNMPIEDYEAALEYYRRIQRELPNYDRIDVVTYHLAKGLLLEGTNKKNPNLTKEGVANLKKVVQRYPKSEYVPESYLALGEYYFDRNMMFYAKNRYEAIINNHKTSSMFNYALYKLAWVYYNLREYEKGIDTFKDVVEKIGATGSRRKIEFRDQALNDLVRVYAEIEEGWQEARRYFLSVLDEDKTYLRLRKLGELLMGMDKDEEAIALYEHFLEKFPSDKLCIEWWDNILGVRVEQGLLDQIEKDTRRMVGFFNFKSSWYGKNKSDEDIVEEARAAVERRTLWISTKYHQEAQRLKSMAFYDKSVDLYKLFLSEFPKSKDAYRVNFYLAEILYDQKKKYSEAVEQYNAVLERDSTGEFTEDAALGAVFCYEELMASSGLRERARGKRKIQRIKLSEKELKKRQDLKKETPLHELEKGFIESADTYVKLVLAWLEKKPEIRKKDPSRGERIPEMSYIAAQTLYDHGMYREAVKRLKVLFDYDPNHQFAAYAVNLLIDAYAKLGHWEKVEDWAEKLIKAKNFKVKSKRELNRIRAIAIGEQAREQTLKKEFSDAVKQNKRIVKEFRRSDPELAATAMYNIAHIYERARDIRKAIKTYREVRKKFPRAKIAPEAQWTIGLIYEAQTQFANAAKAFEGMEDFKKYEKSPDAIKNAGLIWEALGKPKKAIKAYKKYVKLFPKRQDTPNVYFRIAVVHEEEGRKPELQESKKGQRKAKSEMLKAKKAYRSFVKKYPKVLPLVVEAHARSAKIMRDLKRNKYEAQRLFKKALESFDKLLDSGQKKGRAKYFAAQSAFLLAEYIYEEFHSVKLEPKTMKNIKLLKKTITSKAELLAAAEKAYQDILDFKEPQWNAAALFRNGLLYYEFARMLLDAPVPDNLPIDVEDQYRYTLEQTAAPVQEKSLTAFGYALRLAHEQKVYSEWSQKSAQYASKVNPDEFPVSHEDKVGYEHTKDTLTSASLIRFLKRGDIVVDMSK